MPQASLKVFQINKIPTDSALRALEIALQQPEQQPRQQKKTYNIGKDLCTNKLH